MGQSWSRQCVSVELGMLLPSARRAELEVRRDDDKWNPLRSTEHRYGLLRRLLFRFLIETTPTFPWGLLWDLHHSSSRIRVDFRFPWSLPDNFTVPSATGNMQFSHNFSAISLPLHWAFEHRFLTRPKFPAPQCLRPWCLLSRSLPHAMHILRRCKQNFLTKRVESWPVFGKDEDDTQSLIRRESRAHWMVHQIVVHKVFSSTIRGLERFTDSSDIPAEVPSLILRTTL